VSVPNTTDTTNPPYNSLSQSSRHRQFRQPQFFSFLKKREKKKKNILSIQLLHPAVGDGEVGWIKYMHTPTTVILLHTFTPPAIGTTLPTYSEMSLIR
jgi:hypothetical protein